MEGCVWPELRAYFTETRGLASAEEVVEFLDVDFRWAWSGFAGRPEEEDVPLDLRGGIVSNPADPRPPLADAHSVADVEAANWADPAWWKPADYAAARSRWPDHAIVASPGWLAHFWSACEAFGMEEALMKLLTEPAVFEAYIARRHAFCMELHRDAAEAASGAADLYYFGDDIASKDALLMRPDLWRRYLKPYLAEEVRFARERGFPTILHACGAVRSILADLIDIGIDCHLVFQTSARDMEPEAIAREFGGRIVFYGGIDVVELLTYGDPAQVREEVRRNRAAFRHSGGYVAANSHHGIGNIRPENLLALFEEAKLG